MEALWILYIGICIAFALGAARTAKKKGYDPTTAGALVGILSFTSVFIVGIIIWIVYAAKKPKHIYCPDCGEPNIFYLKTCRRCQKEFPTKKILSYEEITEPFRIRPPRP